MALSPADFYAYSRATGAPIPEDAEERARMAPDVYNFRQNQLKTPEQGPNYGAIAGLSALGLGLAAGGVGLARALKGRAPQVAAKQRQAAEPVVQVIAKAGVPVVRTTTEIPDRQRMVRRHGRMVALPDSVSRIQQEIPVAKDRAQELVDEYRNYIDLEQKGFAPQTKSERTEQLAEQNRQRGAVNRAIRSRGEELLAEIQNEAKPFNRTYIESTDAVKPVLDVRTRLNNAGIFLSGPLDELEISSRNSDYPSRLNHPYSSHPKESIRQTAQQEEQMAQALLQKAGVTPEEATSYWKGVLDRFVETDEDLTSIQQSEAPQLAAQQRAAVESGEDQATGRFQHLLQLNEDLDTSQINVMEAMAEHQYRVGMEQDEPGHVPTRQRMVRRHGRMVALPDGIPHIQQEDPVAKAQNFLMQRRMELIKEGFSPEQIEKQLLEGPHQTTLKQGLELWASTGDPAAAEMISGTPSVPLVVKPSVQLKTQNTEEIPTGEFFETWKARELDTDELEDRDIHYTNRISMLGDKFLSVPSHIPNPKHQELSETALMAGHAWKQGDRSERVRIIGTNASKELKKVTANGDPVHPEFIPNPEHAALREEIAFANAQRNDVRAQIAAKQQEVTDFAGVMKLKNIKEGTRAFGVVDPETQEIIIDAETGRPMVEVRSGRPSLPAGTAERAASGTSIRGVGGASGTGLGSAPGVYEPGAVLSAVVIEDGEERYRPVMWEQGKHPASLRTPEGYVYSEAATQRPTATQRKSFSTRPSSKPEVARRSVDVASEIRRLQSSNRPDAQQQLQQFMQTLRG